MKFLDIVDNLQKENKGYIIFIRCGIFFNAIGKDAVIVNKLLGLQNTCFKENMCKCGIPVNSFAKYIPTLKRKGYSYIIYDYDKDIDLDSKDRYREIARVDGMMMEEENTCLNCESCRKCKNKPINDIDSNIKLIKEMLDGSK